MFHGYKFLNLKELEFLDLKFYFYTTASMTPTIKLIFMENLLGVSHCSKEVRHVISLALHNHSKETNDYHHFPCRGGWKEAQKIKQKAHTASRRQGTEAGQSDSWDHSFKHVIYKKIYVKALHIDINWEQIYVTAHILLTTLWDKDIGSLIRTIS